MDPSSCVSCNNQGKDDHNQPARLAYNQGQLLPRIAEQVTQPEVENAPDQLADSHCYKKQYKIVAGSPGENIYHRAQGGKRETGGENCQFAVLVVISLRFIQPFSDSLFYPAGTVHHILVN